MTVVLLSHSLFLPCCKAVPPPILRRELLPMLTHCSQFAQCSLPRGAPRGYVTLMLACATAHCARGTTHGYALRTAHCAAAHCALLTCSRLTARCSRLTAHCSLLMAYGSLLSCSLTRCSHAYCSTTHGLRSLLSAHCLLLPTHGLRLTLTVAAYSHDHRSPLTTHCSPRMHGKESHVASGMRHSNHIVTT